MQPSKGGNRPNNFVLAVLGLASRSGRRTRFGMTQWVWSWGSPSRLVRCTKVAAASPEVGTRTRTPCRCWRATAQRDSAKSSAVATASTWAIDTAEETSGVAKAHSSDTDFGAEKVTS